MRRIPAGAWTRPVVVALLACALLAVCAEALWRGLGHLPSADVEDLDLWAQQRRRASNKDPNTIVIIGKSRAQLDVDGATIKGRYPSATVVQLALRGRSAWATFQDLAQDPRFSGRVLWFLTEADLTPQARAAQLPAVTRAQDAGPDAIWSAALRAQVASRLALRHADLNPSRIVQNLAEGRGPPPHFVTAAPDRFSSADFSRVDVRVLVQQIDRVHTEMRSRMQGTAVDPVRWRTEVAAVKPLVAQLRRRGGDVVLVAPPVSGSSQDFGEQFYPRAVFWDTLAVASGARTVHADDLSGADFVCPDGSHLNHDDAVRFTRALFDELARTRFLAAPSSPL